MASATPSPYDQSSCRYASVVSQSITAGAPGTLSASGCGTTCAAAYAIRLVIGVVGRVQAPGSPGS
jgi:hypothetical protein